jgi:transcriptional regulator with XRE-family HTH domain
MKKLIIKQIREDSRISQQELANAIGMNRSYLSAIENGKFIPYVDTLLEIARALNCKYTDLYEEEDLENIKDYNHKK